ERKNDLEAALQFYDQYLDTHPGDNYAAKQRVRVRAKMLDPEALIDEIAALRDLGEEVSPALLPEYVRKLFESGQAPKAREEVSSRLGRLDGKMATQLAWICYKAQAYDLACTLFLAHLAANLDNRKYLVALEAAATRCNRIAQVIEAYHPHLGHARHLYGRSRSLSRRSRNRR
ncbi:MAG TPA: hypothetical protein VE398_20465, partial [Acidobacteriota bacterium]|nr:hypothetical protein [Acidobacteriota bacterium]